MSESQSIPSEIWKPVPGYEGLYEVSNLGRIKSLHKHSGVPADGILKPYPKKKYLVITLRKNGSVKYATVHRLVLKAFAGPPPVDQPQANHIDGNPHNNRAENLEWCSASENQIHARRIGLAPVGSQCYNAKLTEEVVLAILTDSRGCWLLSKQYGVSKNTIQRIRQGKKWKHLSQAKA